MNKTLSYKEALENSVKYFNGDELAGKVFCDKYALRNEKDELLEDSPEMMHWRIANELGRIEKNKFKNPLSNQEIFNYFDKFKKIIPQGSVMFGAGNYYHYITLSNCVHGESLVYTKEHGLVKMKDIKPGYHVLTHKDRFKKVIKHWSNGIKDTLTVSRTFGNKRIPARDEEEMSRFLSVTPEHRLYSVDNEWLTAEEMYKTTNSKRLKAPKFKYEGNIPDLFPVGNGKHIIIDNDFMWIIGMYLAEGAIKKIESNHPATYFTLNSNESEYAKKISEFSNKIFGHEAWIQKWEDYNFIQVNIFEPNFAILIDRLFGHGFKDKRLPEWIFGLEKSLQQSLIEGFLEGDATNYENIEDGYNFFSIANPTLAYQLGLVCRNIGKNVRFNFLTKGKLIKNRSIAVTISDKEDKVCFTKSPVLVEVFDMEVEDDHSFVAGDIICHNCYVIESPLDSYGGICRTDEQLLQISKRRGGNGADISHIRPAGMPVKNSSRTTTGIIPFMRRFSNSIREVGQGGRRGALMLTISIHHPQIIDFCCVKKDKNEVTGANISIRLTDEFLNAVDKDLEYEQRWPVDAKVPTISKKVKARDIWKIIIENAHNMAEPGLLFWDTIIKESPADCYKDFGFETISTNPCSELPLSILDSCRLCVINLYSYVRNPFTEKSYFDYVEFDKDCRVLQRIMDDIVDLELEHIERIINKIKQDPESEEIKSRELDLWNKIKTSCFNGRRTGSGITGLGDTLAALGIEYGSEKSIQKTSKIYKSLKLACYWSSVEMAKELGAFKVWNHDLEKNNPFLLRIKDEDENLWKEMKKYGRRNIAILTTAPTGTVSLLTQTSSGIEPVFQLSYIRRKKITHEDKNAKVDFIDNVGDKWQEFIVYHNKVKDWMDITKESDIKKSPWHNCCAEDINWPNRVKLQAAAQKHIDHAISSTLNLPENVSVEKVAEIYESAWKSGCKGITIYRKNCRTGVLVDIEKKQENIINIIKRPKELNCDVHFVNCDKEQYYIIIGKTDHPYEVFAGINHYYNKEVIPTNIKYGKLIKESKGKYTLSDDKDKYLLTNGHSDYNCDALTRLVSTSLRHSVPIQFITEQLLKTEGDMFIFSKVIARVLKKYIKDGTKSGKCESCGSENVEYNSGCSICKDCSHTRCQ